MSRSGSSVEIAMSETTEVKSDEQTPEEPGKKEPAKKSSAKKSSAKKSKKLTGKAGREAKSSKAAEAARNTIKKNMNQKKKTDLI